MYIIVAAVLCKIQYIVGVFSSQTQLYIYISDSDFSI